MAGREVAPGRDGRVCDRALASDLRFGTRKHTLRTGPTAEFTRPASRRHRRSAPQAVRGVEGPAPLPLTHFALDRDDVLELLEAAHDPGQLRDRSNLHGGLDGGRPIGADGDGGGHDVDLVLSHDLTDV